MENEGSAVTPCEMTKPFTFQKLYLCCSQENKLLEGKGKKQDLVRSFYEGSLMKRQR